MVTSSMLDPSNPGVYNTLPSKITYTESADGFSFPTIYNNDSLSTIINPNSAWNNGGASNARVILYNQVN